MARGKQKLDSQQKNAEKLAKLKKPSSQIAAREAGFKFDCKICGVKLTSTKMLQQHFEAKHPKLPLPEECAAGAE